MEHLPLPEGSKHFMVVPYYVPNPESDWYDGEGFQEYPERRGWSEENLLGVASWGKEDAPFGTDEDGNPRDPKETERFFQTWLFFGTAIEVLKAGDVRDVTTESFLQPKGLTVARIVTTSKLPSMLLEWGTSMEDKESLWSAATLILERALFYLNRFCQAPRDKHPSDRRKAVTWPVSDVISTSVIALIFTLREAATQKCDKVVGGGLTPIDARSETLYRRLERNWCLADATTIEDELDIDGQYFFAMSPGHGEDELDDHIGCTRERCHFIMDENLYLVKHAPSPWHRPDCEPARWGGNFGGSLGKANSWVDSVLEILKADAIPIVLWSGKFRQYYTVEFHKEGILRPDYIAVSHVWADGKGNPKENSLPECQIDRIQSMVEDIRYEGRKPPATNGNSDGIGFWMDTMCVPVGDENKALRKKAISEMRYIYQNAACVLILDEWLQQIPSTAATPIILTRMYQSSWIKRLWTHQEGFFPKEIYVQFSDKAVKLDSITDKSTEYQRNMAAKGYFLRFPNLTSLRFSTQYGFLKNAYLSIAKEGKIWMLYKPLSHIMGVRQTSRQADETVCLATILGLDVRRYLDIPDKPDEEAAKQRMAILLGEIKTFDMGIIFNNWERLQIQGLTWAPKTLLGHRGGRNYSDLGSHDERESQIHYEGSRPLGLPVQYPGFSTFDFSQATRQSISCADQAFAIQCTPGEVAGTLFMVQVYPVDIAWDAWSQYTIILSKVPEEDEGVLAVIGEGVTGHKEVTDFQHFCLARVRIMKDEYPEWVDVVAAELLPADTKWLVK